MPTYTAKLGQFQVPGRADLGTIEGVQLLQDGQPVAILWSLLDKRFYGAEKEKELRATLAAAKRIIGRHDNYAAIVAAFCDHSREYHRALDLPYGSADHKGRGVTAMRTISDLATDAAALDDAEYSPMLEREEAAWERDARRLMTPAQRAEWDKQCADDSCGKASSADVRRIALDILQDGKE